MLLFKRISFWKNKSYVAQPLNSKIWTVYMAEHFLSPYLLELGRSSPICNANIQVPVKVSNSVWPFAQICMTDLSLILDLLELRLGQLSVLRRGLPVMKLRVAHAYTRSSRKRWMCLIINFQVINPWQLLTWTFKKQMEMLLSGWQDEVARGSGSNGGGMWVALGVYTTAVHQLGNPENKTPLSLISFIYKHENNDSNALQDYLRLK